MLGDAARPCVPLVQGGNTPHKAAMRSMELMIVEVKPKVEKALGAP